MSTGAIYSHFASKSELLLAAISESTPRLVAEHLASGGQGSILDLLGKIGADLPERAEKMGPMMLEIIMTSPREPEIAEVVSREFTALERTTADALRLAQANGGVVDSLDARALSRLILLIVFGSMVAATVGLEQVETEAWNAVLVWLLDAVHVAPRRGP